MNDLIPFIRDRSMQGQFVVTSKGNLSRFLQKSVGDVISNTPTGKVIGIEMKIEQKTTGNLFLETWSNRQHFTVGWMFNLNTDFLFYYFLDTRKLLICSFRKLRRWAFIGNDTNGFSGNIYKYPEKKQRVREQLNDTWGRCVPVKDLEKAMPLQSFDLTQEYSPEAPEEIEEAGVCPF